MKLRFEYDNWDYGTIGEKVSIEGVDNLYVGDIYRVLHGGEITNHIIVNKKDEYSGKRTVFLMGLGELMSNERVKGLFKSYTELKVGEEYNLLTVCVD